MADEDRTGETDGDTNDEGYRVVTFHSHKGAPPTMAMAQLHTSSRYQVAMRALPDLPDDTGALAIALDTDELVDALSSICAHLDEERPPQGSTGIHDDQVRIHWYLRNPATGFDDDLDEWLPDDVEPDHVVVWWATASVDPSHRTGPAGAGRVCRRLRLPQRTVTSAATGEDRLAAATDALADLAGETERLAELAALTHEGASIGLGPSRHLRVAQAVASATDTTALWSSAAMAGMLRADALASTIFPVLTGAADGDPRRQALTDAIVGWVTGIALAAELHTNDTTQLVAPVALVLCPGTMQPVDVDGPCTPIIEAVLADEARLLRSLHPAHEVADRSSLTRARRRLRMALACEQFRQLGLSAERRDQLAHLAPDRSERARLLGVLLDLCAAAFCAVRDPSLAVLRPVGVPDALWDSWVNEGTDAA